MEKKDFYKSLDFMKLGQAIQKQNWQIASLTVRRMENMAKDLEIAEFEKNFASLRQCINRREKNSAQQVLSIMVNKRAAYLNGQKFK